MPTLTCNHKVPSSSLSPVHLQVHAQLDDALARLRSSPWTLPESFSSWWEDFQVFQGGAVQQVCGAVAIPVCHASASRCPLDSSCVQSSLIAAGVRTQRQHRSVTCARLDRAAPTSPTEPLTSP